MRILQRDLFLLCSPPCEVFINIAVYITFRRCVQYVVKLPQISKHTVRSKHFRHLAARHRPVPLVALYAEYGKRHFLTHNDDRSFPSHVRVLDGYRTAVIEFHALALRFFYFTTLCKIINCQSYASPYCRNSAIAEETRGPAHLLSIRQIWYSIGNR